MKTINHRFELKSQDPDRPGGILYLCHLHKPFKYGIGNTYTIAPRLWDLKTKRPTKDKKLIREFKVHAPDIETHLKNLTTRIDNICTEVERFVSVSEINGINIDLKALKEHLDEKIKQTVDNRPKRLKIENSAKNKTDLSYILDYSKTFISDIEEGKRTISSGPLGGNKYKSSTVRAKKRIIAKWLEFEKKEGKHYKWEELDLQIYRKFINFLNKKNLKTNYIGDFIKNLKVIAQAAYEDKIHKNMAFRETGFKKLTATIQNICLTQEELDQLAMLDLRNKPGWDKARDLFLIGCYTGLRFSDIKRLTINHVQGKEIVMPAQKTQQEVRIPINTPAKNILVKNGGKTPKLPDQKVNEYIKEIAKLAEINTQIERSETKGGIQQIEQYRKYELIATHTARRTFATLLYSHPTNPMKPLDIMKLTGHKSLTVFQKYICTGTDEQTKRILDNPYFK